MASETDVNQAVDWLTWLFGRNPKDHIYILRSRPSTDPVKAKQEKLDLKPVHFSEPESLNTTWWEAQSHLWSQYFCVASLHSRDQNNELSNCVNLPAMWLDIDGCKELGIPGEEFLTELRNEDVSAWVRSSQNGIQGYFKLDEPYQANGNAEAFAEDVAGLLFDICYYYGGDWRVVTLNRLMRLPGSLNLKREYNDRFMASAQMYNNTYTLSDLKKRFKPDPTLVPRLVSYACQRALIDIWREGERHEIMLRFIGSVRKNGIDKDSCKTLCTEVQGYFADGEDRTADIDSTYDKPLDSIMTLWQDYKEIAAPVDAAIKFWATLKVRYCKKRGFEFFPENVDPTKPPQTEGVFYEQGLETWYDGREAPERFSNFIIRLKGKLIKANTLTSVWLAEIMKEGDSPTLVEIPAERHNNWGKFATIPGLPSGMSVFNSVMWAQYVAYLDASCPKTTMVESTFYGLLDVDKPTLLLPNVPHPTHMWSGGEDTAISGAFTRELDKSEIGEYLKTFVEYYSGYHEPRYIWPALGWFAACSMSYLIRRQFQSGFPTLVICGLPGSGKSQLIEEVLCRHYGCQAAHGYMSTTTYAMKQRLVSNNVCPMVVDEFRSGQSFSKKLAEMQDVIRSLWGQNQTSRGTLSGELDKKVFVTPLCLIGEHHYTDEATIHRTFSIRLERSWMGSVRAMTPQDRKTLEHEQRWLHDSEHKGKLGTLLIQWMMKNMDAIPTMLEASRAVVNENSAITVERKKICYTTVVAGLSMLSRMYEDYGLEFPLNKRRMLKAVYSADTSMRSSESFDNETLQTLFDSTDHVIINSLRQRVPLAGSLYTYDLEDHRYAYFDMGRWFRLITGEISDSESGTLSDKTAFRAMILDNHSTNPETPFVAFPENHPIIRRSCVKVDLHKIQQHFGINVNQWEGYIDGSI